MDWILLLKSGWSFIRALPLWVYIAVIVACLALRWHAHQIDIARAEVHAQYAARDAEAVETATRAWLEDARRAAASAQVIADAVGLARTLIATNTERTIVRVREVSNAVRSNPDLAGVRQPADVVRIHAEAVAESAAAAERARRSFDARLEAVRKAAGGR